MNQTASSSDSSQQPAPFHSPIKDQRWDQACYLAAVRCAWVAAVFSLLVGLLLAADYVQREAKDPFESPAFLQLKAQLAQQPDNQQLREQLRRLDVELRRQHFRHRRFAQFGAWLLLGGMLVSIASYKTATVLRRKLPMPQAPDVADDAESQFQRQARWAVGALAVAVALGVLTFGLALRSPLPPADRAGSWIAQQTTGGQSNEVSTAAAGNQPVAQTSHSAASSAATERLAPQPAAAGSTEANSNLASPPATTAAIDTGEYPSEEELRKNWHRFRGPGGSGISAFANAPLVWDATTGEGVLWKSPVPLPGNNSPVVWGDRVFLSGATPEKQQVYCFDAQTGKLLWQGDVPIGAEGFDPDSVFEDTGLAAPTTTTDGRRVFAIFATGDVAAFDFDGKALWSRNLGVPDSAYGYAASLEMYRNLLLIQFDQGSTAKEGKSRLFALQAATGNTVYEVARPVPNSWASPVVVRAAGREQLITCGDPWTIAYEPATGDEIWRVKCLAGDVGPSPTVADDVVHVGNEFCIWSAIRADGQGDVTDSHVVWTAEDGLPDTASPLVTSEYLILAASWGAITCYDVKTGEKLWELELDASLTSSPGMAGKYVYQFGEQEAEDAAGERTKVASCWVIEPAREEGKIVAENRLGEGCVTSPAFQDGRIYIRGSQHLFCLGAK